MIDRVTSEEPRSAPRSSSAPDEDAPSGDGVCRAPDGEDGQPRYPYVHVDVPSAAAEAISWELWEHGACGVEQRDGSTLSRAEGSQVTLVASFDDEDEASRVARALDERYHARVEHVVGDDWRHAWKRYFEPVRVGQRLLVRPFWEQGRAWPEDVVLTLDPGLAFGSGMHETTQLVLREIDRLVRGGEHVLDVGCGSGILSVAALLLGAERARAVDIDPQAIAATRDNARINRVASRVVTSLTPVERLRNRFALVVANVQPEPLIRHAPAIADRVAPGGTLVLSGILLERMQEVRAAYEGMRVRLVPRQGPWVALVMKRANEGAIEPPPSSDVTG